MKIIGVTGGVGSGKSALLHEVEKRYGDSIRVIYADDVANRVKEPGGLCYNEIVSLLGEDVLDRDEEKAIKTPDGGCLFPVDRKKMAAMLFEDADLRKQVNALLHPAVKMYVRDAIASESAIGIIDFLIIEAALLIEDGYEAIVDEMWVVTAPLALRRQRLRSSRGYSEEKTDAIINAQMDDAQYVSHADFVIDNGGTLEEALTQIQDRLGSM